jgi:hypothetical protein
MGGRRKLFIGYVKRCVKRSGFKLHFVSVEKQGVFSNWPRRDGNASRMGHGLAGISSADTAAGRPNAPRGGKRRTRKPGKILLIISSRIRVGILEFAFGCAFDDFSLSILPSLSS